MKISRSIFCAALFVAGLLNATAQTATPLRLVNMSILLPVPFGSSVTLGFVVSGDGAKTRRVLVRAVGPSLRQFVADATASTSLQVNGGAGSTIVATWADNPAAVTAAANSVGAFPFAAGSLDSAVIIEMPVGSATVTVRSSDDAKSANRSVIIEAYELPAS